MPTRTQRCRPYTARKPTKDGKPALSNRANNILIQALGFCRNAEIVEEERTEVNLAAPDRPSSQKGIGARVVYEGRMGYAWSESSTSDTELLKQAILAARTGPTGSFAEKGALPRVINPTPDTNLQDSLHKMQGLIKGLDFLLPSLLPDRSFQLQARLLQHSLVLTTSSGTRAGTRILHILSLRSSDYPSVSASIYTTVAPESPSDLLCRLAWRTVHSREVAWPDGRTLPAVFTASACGSLLEDFVLDALTLPAPHSYYAKVPYGQSWLHRDITLYDDGSLPGGFGTTAFDGEGLPRQRRELVHDGRLVFKLMNIAQAKELNITAPGLATRSWGQQPTPGYSNLVLAPGELSLGELCADLDYGILLDSLVPVEPSLRRPGEFCRRAQTAFIIQGGRPICRIPQMLVRAKYEDLLGKDFLNLGFERALHGRTLAPPLEVANITLEEHDLDKPEDLADLPGLWW